MGKKTTRFRNFLLVFDERTTVKFEHWALINFKFCRLFFTNRHPGKLKYTFVFTSNVSTLISYVITIGDMRGVC